MINKSNVSEIYSKNISYLRDYIKNEVEKSVYASMDLNSIIKTQNLISLTVERMREEINGVDRQIQVHFKGESMKSYQLQLRDLKKLLKFFNKMIDDCFGTNVK